MARLLLSFCFQIGHECYTVKVWKRTDELEAITWTTRDFSPMQLEISRRRVIIACSLTWSAFMALVLPQVGLPTRRC